MRRPDPRKSRSLTGWLLVLFVINISPSVYAEKSLNIAVWGGAYERAQQIALFTPFTQQTGIKITTRAYTGGLDIFKQQSLPDLIDMTESDARQACNKNLLQPIDYLKILSASPDTKDDPGKISVDFALIRADFLEDSFLPCSVAHISYSNVIAYDSRAFPGEKPQTINDFFNIKRFPGKRALRKEVDSLLEWALMADKVPLSQIYDLLSTERGIRLALQRLNTIKPSIVWWQDPSEPPQLLASGEVTMASGYNGRFFDAQLEGTPLLIIWHGQIIDHDVWAIPAGKPLSSEIRQFLRFATQSRQMARLAENIPYGPTRRSALKQIGSHPRKPIPMLNHLPTATHHLDHALFRDTLWYAHTAGVRKRAFEAWLAE